MESKSNKTVWIVIILIIVIVGGYFVLKGGNNNTNTAVPESQSTNSVELTGEVKEFNVEASRFQFNPSTIEVNLGDTVRLTASSSDVPHSLTLPDFKVDLYLNGLTSETAEFVADKKGTFEFFCNVPCGVGHNTMKGTFTVK